MRTLSLVTALFAFILSSSAFAEESKPIELTAPQMDQVTGGVGSGDKPGAGEAGWNGLLIAGHFGEEPAKLLGLNSNAPEVWVPGKL